MQTLCAVAPRSRLRGPGGRRGDPSQDPGGQSAPVSRVRAEVRDV